MTITATIIADSVSLAGDRLTTMQLRYPRFIHAELMTHRAFSRNASSSRAIPVQRLVQDVLDDTAMPIHWGKNQPGMQAREEHDALVVFRNDSVSAEVAWLRARDVAVAAAERFTRAGYHKQVVNRLLEPFAHINVVVTATEWENFFQLRLHPDAQPEIHQLAIVMREVMDASQPRLLDPGDWHLPFTRNEDEDWLHGNLHSLKRVSAARCARTSYLTHDRKTPLIDADLGLAAQLRREWHMSPFEHQATPAAGQHANFRGWRSFRQEIESQ